MATNSSDSKPPAATSSDKPAARADNANALEALRAENARLREENAQLRRGNPAGAAEREGLARAAGNTPRSVTGPNGEVSIPDDVFLSQGLREELERNGRAIDPLTGRRIGDWSAVDGAERNASTGPERGF